MQDESATPERPSGPVYGDVWHRSERHCTTLMHLSGYIGLLGYIGTLVFFSLILFIPRYSYDSPFTSLLISLMLLLLGNIIGPLAIWLIARRKSNMVDYHGKRAINFQMSVSLYSLLILGVGVAFLVLGLWAVSMQTVDNEYGESWAGVGVAVIAIFCTGVLLFVLGLVWFTWTGLAAIRSCHGNPPKYILAIPFLR